MCIYIYIYIYILWVVCVCEQYWTSPGGNTPQGTNYMANCLPSQKLYKLDEPDTQDTAGEARMNSSVMYSYGPPHMAKQKQEDQLEHTYSSYVRIQDLGLKTCQKRWTIGRSGERGSGISVLAARHDDDDIYIYIYIFVYIYIYVYILCTQILCVYIYIYIYILCINMCVFVCAYIYVCVCVCVCECIYVWVKSIV